MKTFREANQDYLTLRRGLGFKFRRSIHGCWKSSHPFSNRKARCDIVPAGFAVGDGTTTHTAGGMGCAVERGARIRALLECHGPVD
jgi:hypothetical protein